jgi:hypothetical protein
MPRIKIELHSDDVAMGWSFSNNEEERTSQGVPVEGGGHKIVCTNSRSADRYLLALLDFEVIRIKRIRLVHLMLQVTHIQASLRNRAFQIGGRRDLIQIFL